MKCRFNFREESATAFEIGYLSLVTINRRSLTTSTVSSHRVSHHPIKSIGPLGLSDPDHDPLRMELESAETESGDENAGKCATGI